MDLIGVNIVKNLNMDNCMQKSAVKWMFENFFNVKWDDMAQRPTIFEEAFLIEQSATNCIQTIDENTSDGYHTFKELYQFRKAYNVALFNEWGSKKYWKWSEKLGCGEQLPKYDVHKSWKHHDGEPCFGGGWFIVVAILPSGQISNHYKAEDWDLFKIPETETAKYPFDGHTGQDVINRLLNL